MRIRSLIIGYALVLAILLFAERRSSPVQPDHYSRVVDLTGTPDSSTARAASSRDSETSIVAPADLIPGTWTAGQIPAERLIAPLVVMDLAATANHGRITLDDIAAWEAQHNVVPQGAVIAIRHVGLAAAAPEMPMPITADAAQFLMDARYALGFAIETSANLAPDRTLARQIALHGAYVVERASRLSSLPETGSLIIVAPAKSAVPARGRNAAKSPVRILAMVK